MASIQDLLGVHGTSTRLILRWVIVLLAANMSLPITWLGFSFAADQPDQPEEPKSIRMTCGTCPSGYALTGVTSSPENCKEGDPTLVQCVPLGANLLSVCGACPEGYRKVGSSSSPARCGNTDGGLTSQCQLEKLEGGVTGSGAGEGGVFCPPNCGSTATPGQGGAPPAPKFRPAPEKKQP